MNETRSADQAQDRYVSVMGHDLGTLYYALWQEVARSYEKWNEHVELFGTMATRVELLNNAAPTILPNSSRSSLGKHVAPHCMSH